MAVAESRPAFTSCSRNARRIRAGTRRRIRFRFPDGNEESITISTGDAVKFSEWANSELGGEHIGETVNAAGARVNGDEWILFELTI